MNNHKDAGRGIARINYDRQNNPFQRIKWIGT